MLAITIAGEELLLLPEKVIWWKKEKALLVADLHLGKSGHFRKSGIAVPAAIEQDDLGILSGLIDDFKPEHIYMLGDLFHSVVNKDWYEFTLWRKQFIRPEFHLIKGNHDILDNELLREAGISVYNEYLDMPPFRFIHSAPVQEIISGSGYYYLSGHIHPGVKLRGQARQFLYLPCFYFTESQGILPAFGRFTGNSVLKIYPADQVYPVLSGKVVFLK